MPLKDTSLKTLLEESPTGTPAGTPASRKRNVITDIAEGRYKSPDTAWPVARRAAHFFAWAAIHWPMQFVPWRYVYKAITGMKSVHADNHIDVLALKRKSGAIREHLFSHYCEGDEGEVQFPGQELKPGCAWNLVVDPLGARATIDMKDFTDTNQRGKALRFLSADRGLLRSSKVVQLDEIPANTPEDRVLRDFAKASKKAATESKRIDFQTLLGATLPPKKKS